MGSANMLNRLQQFRLDVVQVMPFLQSPRSNTESDTVDDELTEEEEEQFAQMVHFLGRLFPFVRPSPEFRARLKEALLAEHRRRVANETTLPARQEGRHLVALVSGSDGTAVDRCAGDDTVAAQPSFERAVGVAGGRAVGL